MTNKRQQLPPQIRKITVTDRSSGKPVVRYQVTVDAGISPETGKRRQIRRRFATETEARAELSATQGGVSAGTYVARQQADGRAGVRGVAGVEALAEAVDAARAPVSSCGRYATNSATSRFRSCRRPTWTVWWAGCGAARSRAARSGRRARCNYMLYLCTAVLDDQVAQGNVVRNVAKLVDRVGRRRREVSHADASARCSASSTMNAATGTCGRWRCTGCAEVRSPGCGGPQC